LCSAQAGFSSWRRTRPCASGSDAVFDLILGAGVSVGLLIYLVWALVRPEDF
jgi:K+-transporting ATPase KdpF subunit